MEGVYREQKGRKESGKGADHRFHVGDSIKTFVGLSA